MRLGDLNAKRVAILGDGAEGAAAAHAIATLAAPASLAVFSNRGDVREDPAFAALDRRPGEITSRDLRAFDVAVKSPGIPLRTTAVVEAVGAGLAVTSGTSLWLRTYAEGPDGARAVGVTGTKGKSTTVTMIAHALDACGVNARAVGNIGVPLLSCAPPDPAVGVWVVELSSAQLADAEGVLDVSVLLNLSPEHLDWHGDVDAYYEAKCRILEMAPRGRRVVGAGSEEIRRRFGADPGVVWSGEGPSGNGLTPIRLANHFGAHAQANAAAALRVLTLLGVDADAGARALGDAPALPHRLEPVRTAAGALWINDSLSTTPVSVLAALDAFAGRRVVLLLGGHDRGLAWNEAGADLLGHADHIDAVVAMPDTGERVAEAVRAAAGTRGLAAPTILPAADLRDAVRIGADRVRTGSHTDQPIVLLSPGAPSYHAYRDHAERARAFAEAIDALGVSEESPA